MRENRGQSTVEYAVITAAGICLIVGLGALMNSIGDGMFVDHAISAASHLMQNGIGGAADVFAF